MMKEAQKLESLRAEVYQNASEILAAMASPVRLRIIQILSHRASSVDELAQRTGEKIGNVSQHLQRLSKLGLVEFEKQGTSRVYHLADPTVLQVWLSLQALAEKVSPQVREKEALLCPEELCSPMTPTEVMNRVAAKKAVLIDVRTQDENEQHPVPGALSIPADQILDKAQKLPKSKTLFLFCRGKYCSLANVAVIDLRAKGFKAFRLKQTYYELNFPSLFSH